MADKYYSPIATTAALGSVGGTKTEVLAIPTSVGFGFLKQVVLVPHGGTGGDSVAFDIRQKNDFTGAEIIHSLLAASGLALTNDTHVYDKTNVTLGDIVFDVREYKAAGSFNDYLYVKITLTDSVSATTVDYTFDVKLVVGRRMG